LLQGESAQRWIVTNGGLGSARTRVTNFFYRWTQSPSCRPPLLLPGSLQGRISPASASPAPKPWREVVRKPPARSPVPHHRAQKRVGGDAPPGVEFVAVVLLLPAQTPAQTRRPGRQRSPLFDRIELEQCFAKVCSAAARRSPPIPFARSPLPNCCYALLPRHDRFRRTFAPRLRSHHSYEAGPAAAADSRGQALHGLSASSAAASLGRVDSYNFSQSWHASLR
jgi:hypothetical protein